MFRRSKLPALIALVSTFAAPALPAQELPAQSPRIVSYVMEVELNPAQHRLAGTQRIRWRNTTAQATSELRFHLYLNAFRGPDSTFMRESDAGSRRAWAAQDGAYYGGVELEEIQLVDDAGRVPLEGEHIAPDDNNEADRTVLRVPLPGPVGPGEEVLLETRFVSTIPKALRRTGWVPGGTYYCMQWFPKLGVLEEVDGGSAWNCHQFHANSEFFADFGNYDVTIGVPGGWVVGATGGRGERQVVGDRVRYTFRQEDVHDFAFVASPDMVVHERTFNPLPPAEDPTGLAPAVAERNGVPLASYALRPVEMLLMLHPEHDTEEQRDRHFATVEAALQWFGLRYGQYPYPAVTVVDPGTDTDGSRLAGGMEYPTLFTCGTKLYPHPREQKPEGVTMHEFGHQFWYGLSANNEFEESWLDEGLNTYSEGRSLWWRYYRSQPVPRRPVETTEMGLLTFAATLHPSAWAGGRIGTGVRLPLSLLPESWTRPLDDLRFAGTLLPDSILLELLAEQVYATGAREVYHQDGWVDRSRALATDNPDPMVRPVWTYLSRASYGANSYTRPATILRSLERLAGRESWWAFLRKFHSQVRYRHPTTEEFQELLAQECGAPVAEFFRLAIGAQAGFDYGVYSVNPISGEGPRKTVTVRRFGNVPGRVRVRFRFANRELPVWRMIAADDLSPWWRFEFDDADAGEEGPYGPLTEVWIDPPDPDHEGPEGPAGVYLLDSNLLNNAWRAAPDPQPVLYRGLRMLLQTQAQLTFSGVIG